MTDTKEIRLTQTVSCAGCAGKIPPAFLQEAVSGIQWYENENVLHAMGHCEDCGVMKLDEKRALIHTTDFFSPVVDDPYTFGQIAAANALSDIYAMGGKPMSALNIVAYPVELGNHILHEILRGGADKAREAECPIVGGHSVKAPEMKYGLAVTGQIDIDNILYNSKAHPGDVLILTKALGTGILNTAVKRGDLDPETEKRLVQNMTQLNKEGGELAARFQASSVTDVTGFGLAGHGMEMVQGAGVSFEIYIQSLPVLPQVMESIDKGYLTGGAKNNRIYSEHIIRMDEKIPAPMHELIFDPQTSGGLLISISEDKAKALLKELNSFYSSATIIGKVKSCETSAKPEIQILW
jgi:selenide,water dikinase